MNGWQWSLTIEFALIGGGWGHSETRSFETKRDALRYVPYKIRRELSQTHHVIHEGTQYLLGRVECPFGTCHACGGTGLWYEEDQHVITAKGCTNQREPLVGRRVRVATIDGQHRGYGRIVKRDGYTVLHVLLNGGPQIPVGDEEFELLLPGFEAHGITYHRIGEKWSDFGVL